MAKEISPAFAILAKEYNKVKITQGMQLTVYLDNCQLIITALNDHDLSREIVAQAMAKSILINAVDKPDLCDFYLGGVVTKGRS